MAYAPGNANEISSSRSKQVGAGATPTPADAVLGGLAYLTGKNGTPKDYAKAMASFQRGANGGNARAMAYLGQMYDDGLGVHQNHAQAMTWYRKAVDAGDSLALNDIGRLYCRGEGVTQDFEQGMAWYRKAADAGNAIAMTNIGDMYRMGRGVSEDYQQALEWYRKGAEAGDAGAMNKVGAMYAGGLGVTPDPQQAIAWYQKAANAGDTAATENLRALQAGSGSGNAPAPVQEQGRLPERVQASQTGAAQSLSQQRHVKSLAEFTEMLDKTLALMEKGDGISYPDLVTCTKVLNQYAENVHFQPGDETAESNAIKTKRLAKWFAIAAACWETANNSAKTGPADPSYELKIQTAKNSIAERDEWLNRAAQEGKLFSDAVHTMAAKAGVRIASSPAKQ